jgi:hypothetical protein
MLPVLEHKARAEGKDVGGAVNQEGVVHKELYKSCSEYRPCFWFIDKNSLTRGRNGVQRKKDRERERS